MNHEDEMLVQAWMQAWMQCPAKMPPPALLREDDGRYTPLGRHDAAICEALKRLGVKKINGVYVIRSRDKTKRLQLAKELDAVHEKILKDSNALGLRDGHHRMRRK